MKVYKATPNPCRICDEKEGIVLPICEDEQGQRFFYPVCPDCLDKVPYKRIPVTTEMDEGYFFCPENKLEKEPEDGQRSSEN